MDDGELDSKISLLTKKINKKSYRTTASKELADLIISNKNSIHQSKSLLGLIAFTKIFVTNRLPIEPVLKQMNNCLSSLKEDNDLFQNSYLVNVELILNRIDCIYRESSKIDKFSQFITSFQCLSPNLSGPYSSKYLQISDVIGTHEKSFLITPQNPDFTTVIMPNDIPRLVFKDNEESAESYILKMYGSNGEYFKHYASFLDCSKIYPNQKHRLKIKSQ